MTDSPKKCVNKLLRIDCPEAKSVALVIMSRNFQQQEVEKWLKESIQDHSKLNSDGKLYLILLNHEWQSWRNALKIAKSISQTDFESTPALYHEVAMSYLVSVVPEYLPHLIYNQLPFNKVDFELPSINKKSKDSLKKAETNFQKARDIATEMNFPKMASRDHDYALWLELEDPRRKSSGLEKLKDLVRDSKTTFHYLPMGIAYDLDIDFEKVKAEIDRLTVIPQDISYDVSTAILALAFVEKTDQDFANFIEKNYDKLTQSYNPSRIGWLYIEGTLSCR